MSEKKRITIYHGAMIRLSPSLRMEDVAKKLDILDPQENEDECYGYNLQNEYEIRRFHTDASEGIRFGSDNTYIFTHVSTSTGQKVYHPNYGYETRENQYFVFISIEIDQINLKNDRFVDCTGPDVHQIQEFEKFLQEKFPDKNYGYSSNMIMEDR